MGTDINLWVEEYVDGSWRYVTPPYLCLDEGTWNPNWESGHYVKSDKPNPLSRSYNVFAFLADVRNGYEFASIPTHDPIVPQFPRRGIPGDSEYIKYQEGGWLGDHSYTWATLRELLDAPWTEVEFHETGLIDYEGYQSYKDRGCPDVWCGHVDGYNVKIYNDEASFLAAKNNGFHNFLRLSWSYNPLPKSGFYRWIYEVLAPRYVGREDQVRILIGFDS